MARNFIGHRQFKGRGAASNPAVRFDALTLEQTHDGWYEDEIVEHLTETVLPDRARSVITSNNSPDVGFSQSINPYRGCAHGCVYCFARPTHAYLGLSPGLDFETRLTAKVNAAEKLREELAKPGYRCEPLTIGVNTDAYQPIERQYKITRSILELVHETSHPVSLITKSALIERDLDLLAPMAKKHLVSVTLSITTLDHEISRRMEPRTSAPARMLVAIRRLTQAGIPVNVNVAPVIPFLTDSELEPIMEAAAKQGAVSAGYALVR